MSGLQTECETQRKLTQRTCYERRCEASRKRRRARRPLSSDALSYSLADAAAMAGGKCENTIRDWAEKGWLKIVKVSRSTLVNGDSLRELLRNGPPSKESATHP